MAILDTEHLAVGRCERLVLLCVRLIAIFQLTEFLLGTVLDTTPPV